MDDNVCKTFLIYIKVRKLHEFREFFLHFVLDVCEVFHLDEQSFGFEQLA